MGWTIAHPDPLWYEFLKSLLLSAALDLLAQVPIIPYWMQNYVKLRIISKKAVKSD